MVGKAVYGKPGRLLNIHIFKEDVGALAAQLQGNVLDQLGGMGDDLPAGGGAACHGDHVHQIAFHQVVAYLGAGTRHHVHHACRETGFLIYAGHKQHGQHPPGRRLNDHRIAGG